MKADNISTEIIEELYGNYERASLHVFSDYLSRNRAANEGLEEYKELVRRFKRCGVADPVEVNEYYEVVAKDVHLRAAYEAGLRHIPVIKRRHPKTYPYFPNRILVELSNKCNLQCVMCPAHGPTKDMKREKVNMSFDIFKKAIDEVAEYQGVGLVFHFYGEPLLNKDLQQCFDFLKTKNTLGHMLMSTNGILLDARIRGIILNSPLDVLQVSLNAATDETYRNITGQDAHEKIVGNVRSLISERNSKKQANPLVRVQMVEMDCNEAEIDHFVNTWEGVADLVHVNCFEKQGGRVIDQRQLKDYTPIERFYCDRFRRRDFVLYSNGLLSVCVYDYDGYLALGNIAEHCISDLMKSEKYEALQKAHESGDLSAFPICQNCTDWMF